MSILPPYSDVPSGRLLHWFAVPEAVTSMSFSANGEFLATTHVDNLGVFLWVNRGLYADVKIKPITAGEETHGAAKTSCAKRATFITHAHTLA